MSSIAYLTLMYCAFMFVILPVASIRTARRISKQRRENRSQPQKITLLYQALMTNCFVLLFAAFFSIVIDKRIYSFPEWNQWNVGVFMIALVAGLLLVPFSAWISTKEEIDQAFFWQLVPETKQQWSILIVTILVGSLAMELAYRGVGWALLGYSTQGYLVSGFICCAAFSLMYSIYSWKQVILMFFYAIMLHALVGFTHSLIPGFFVSICFNLLAAIVITRAYNRTAPTPYETSNVITS